ncbi:UNKNOWN [Stylonychia lemnae]|uniref:Transmembrane protein n=1 Tax=Stylonychia lemnae TaxID=5949 RepID=A0A078A7F4_STYLE|nr:UNKNOWN [Stylonychia lemnae]|eukprot:CDW78180.1 UNKNOWN [Stylonychia lemnae]
MQEYRAEEKIRQYKSEICYRAINCLSKMGIAIAGVVYSIRQISLYDSNYIPQYEEQKFYYLFLSVFLLIECLDQFIDFFYKIENCSLKYRVTAIIGSVVIMSLQIPFIIFGVLMYIQRVDQSWGEKKNIFVSYELAQSKTIPNISKQERIQVAGRDANQYIESLQIDYLIFSIITAIGLVENVCQITSVIIKLADKPLRRLIEELIFRLLFRGAGVIVMIQIFLHPLQLSFFIDSRDKGEINLWKNQSRYSKIASFDQEIGIERAYALVIAALEIMIGVYKCAQLVIDLRIQQKENKIVQLQTEKKNVLENGKKIKEAAERENEKKKLIDIDTKLGVEKQKPVQGFNVIKLIERLCTFVILPGMILFLSILVYNFINISSFTFDEQSAVFFSSICIELGLVVLVLSFLICALLMRCCIGR